MAGHHASAIVDYVGLTAAVQRHRTAPKPLFRPSTNPNRSGPGAVPSLAYTGMKIKRSSDQATPFGTEKKRRSLVGAEWPAFPDARSWASGRRRKTVRKMPRRGDVSSSLGCGRWSGERAAKYSNWPSPFSPSSRLARPDEPDAPLSPCASNPHPHERLPARAALMTNNNGSVYAVSLSLLETPRWKK